MDGIDKITGRISQDVQREIDELNANAKRDAEEIRIRYMRMADSQADEIIARGRKNADERVERLASVAELEARKLTLAAKQQMLEKTFEKALEDLLNLPEKEYVSLLSSLAAKAAISGREQVILSQKDRTRYGKQVVTQANELLEKDKSGRTAGLTLSSEARPIRGGLVLSDSDIEVNCTFETLVRLQKEAMAAEVAKVLFD